MIRRSVLALILAFGVGPTLFAQITEKKVLPWVAGAKRDAVTAPQRGEAPAAATRAANPKDWMAEQVYFDMDRGGLPLWTPTIEVPRGTRAFQVALEDAVWEPVPAAMRTQFPALDRIGALPIIRTHVGIQRKEALASVVVEPFKLNTTSGVVERLVEARLRIHDVVQGEVGAPKSYPAASKLASGQWYRMFVPDNGVYKVTYQTLSQLGVDMNGLDPARINIYGNHTGLLPFQNSALPGTDLRANAIEMVDGGDGVFGPGDHLLFYASGPQRWATGGKGFAHTKNVYCDSASYFVGIDVEPAVRVAPASQSSGTPSQVVTTYSERAFIERDLINLLKSGRTWFGELFDQTLTYPYTFNIPGMVLTDSVFLRLVGAARTVGTANSSSFDVSIPGQFSTSFTVNGVPESYTSTYGLHFDRTYGFLPTSGSIAMSMTFNKFNPITSLGWMDFVEINCRRDLRLFSDQLAFRDLRSVGAGAITEFVVDQAQNVHRIWEITDPAQPRVVQTTLDGTMLRFTVATDSLRQFVAFKNSNYPEPTPIGAVPNQNLHGTPTGIDLTIICPPQFQAAAGRLAERRRSEGLDVLIVSPQQVYNEFSSGARDATAIKRFMRMQYDRATTPEEMPRYLLLFGDGSYNNISLAEGNQNWIPTYQTTNVMDPARSYATDDYFGFLDPTEGEYTGDLVDIGIGRLPVSSVEIADQAVNKLLRYDATRTLSFQGSSCTANGDGGLPDWRTHVLFASDDQTGEGFENTIHMSQSETLAQRVVNEHPYLNVDKVYLDAYQQVSTPGGARYPQAATDLQDKVENGLLLVNYIGHGGEVGWAHERFLDNTTILGWTNGDRLPLFMTATCEFTRWDDPSRTSAGEYVFLNPDGGGIGLMTTSRLAYSLQNFNLGNKFYDHVFRREEELGREERLGDIYRQTKRAIATTDPNSFNHMNFCLLGDPSLRLALPRNGLTITSITDTLGAPMDTLKALATVRIHGFVDNGSGQPMTDFNGVVVPTVFDKSQQQYTLANDPPGDPFPFQLRKNVIHRGRATVTHGEFDFTFVVPKDINYQVGPGRVSCYAENATTNANGYTNDPLVGSTATNVALDETGPQVRLYMNDDNFVPGGITDEDPLIFAKLFDENGINTVGSSIGHDLLAVLDENTDQAIVLNDLYQADMDTYRSGEVRYRLNALAEGEHTLRLKAWDTFNNSTEANTSFLVTSSEELALDHVLNYPNPFTTRTEFYFEHNRPCTNLEAQVQVFTVSGRLVKTLNRRLACEGYRSEGLPWDGLDDFGDKLGRGVYVYRLHVTTPDGEQAEKFEKLVILR
jgi:hypothetical protein